MTSFSRVTVWRPGGPGERAVGRASEVERAVHLVRQGRSVAVVGERWSGRSTVLREIGAALEDLGRTVRPVPSLWTWSDSQTLDGRAARSSPEAIGGALALAALDDALEGVSPEADVVLVDDVDQLDEPSRALLRVLHRRSGVPFVTTRLARGRRPEAGRSAEIAPSPVETPLPPLGFGDLHALLERRLGGKVSPELTARVLRESSGLPGLALAAVDGAIAGGTVREVAGVWVGEDLWSVDLHGVFGALLAPLSDDELTAVELVAHTGTLAVDVAERVVEAALVDALEDQGLVHVVSSPGERLLAVRPAGLAAHLLRRPMSARLLRALTRASAALQADGRPLDERASQVLSRLDGWTGRGPALHPPAPAVTGPESDVVLAHALRDAREAALAAWQRSRCVVDAVRVLRSLGVDPRDRPLVDHVLSVTDRGTDAGVYERVALRYLEARLAVLDGRPAGEVADDLDRAAVAGGAVERALGPLAYLLRVEFGRLPADYDATLAPLVGRPGHEGTVARLVLAACHVLAARHAEAAALLDVDRGAWPRVLAEDAELVLGLAEFAAGDLAAAADRGAAMVVNGAHAASGPLCVSGYYVASLGFAARGRFEQARQHLVPALSLHGGWSGLLSPERAVRAMLVYLSVLSRHELVAPGSVGLVDAARSSGDALPYGARDLPAAMERFAAGSPEDAAAAMDDVAADLRARGLDLSADTVEVLRLLVDYDADRAAAVTPGVRRVGGPPFDVFLDTWRARRAEDPAALIEVGERFDRLGLPWEAGRCYAFAAALYRQAGDHDRAGRARRAIQALQADDPAAAVPDDRDGALTDREREIIGQIAAGSSNAQVAARLMLSVRTVETHLRNIRRKTGVQDRGAIARLVD